MNQIPDPSERLSSWPKQRKIQSNRITGNTGEKNCTSNLKNICCYGSRHCPCLTVLTNPHCEPCSRMHQRIGQLLDIYRRYPVEKALEIYDEWFEGGKYQIAFYLCKFTEIIKFVLI